MTNNLLHDIWQFAKENPSLCSEAYNKKAFQHVEWWLTEFIKAKQDTVKNESGEN